MLDSRFRAASAALLVAFLTTCGGANSLRIEVGATRSPESMGDRVDAVARQVGQRLAELSSRRRALDSSSVPFSVPMRATLTQGGLPLPTVRGASRGPEAGGGLTLAFETTGDRAFPSDYRAYLQQVFAAAEPAMTAVFGPPATAGTVRVLSYEADIPARQAVAGGVYVVNGPLGPEIRFPVYQSPASTAVNFIHCLLLAYQADKVTPFDAYNEGLVRAATMQVARVPGSIPSVTADSIEQTLDNLYDISASYHWSNYPGVGAPSFIAPNLLTDPLPVGGSTGGAYLLRYKMAGTAWSKVLTQYPAFIRSFNQSLFAAPSLYQTEVDLVQLGQTTLNSVAGAPGATIEGLSFADWALRQAILDTRRNAGLKVVPEVFPLSPTAGSADFGPFAVILHAFRTSSAGSETLLDGTSYPLYWRNDFTRFFTAVQDDRMSVTGGYGSVAPNFPARTSANVPYRVAIDLPFQSKLVRLYVPAGSIATGAAPTAKNFYGTLVGFDGQNGLSLQVDSAAGVSTIPITDGAFGATIDASLFDAAQMVRIRLLQGSSILVDQRIAKGKGPMAVDLRSPASDTSFVFARENRLVGVGFPIDPYRPNPADTLSLPDNQTLVARWNPFFSRYDFYPSEGEFRQGLGYFVRGATTSGILVQGRTSEKTPLSVALQPGWNLVSLPSSTAVTTLDVQATTTTQAVVPWSEARGVLVGDTFFTFNPDPGNPDAGSLLPATTFEPGKAYFVRCLASEGAVLVFRNGATRSRSMQTLTKALAHARELRDPAALRKGGGVTSGNTGNTGKGGGNGLSTWIANIQVRSTQGQYCEAVLGMQSGAQAGIGVEDHPLPTGPGGFQMSFSQHGNLYRDVRPILSGTRYRVTLSGLIPGTQVSFVPQFWIGSANLTVHGLPGGSQTLPRTGLAFWPTTSTMTLEIEAR